MPRERITIELSGTEKLFSLAARTFVWLAFFGLLFFLRSFFLLVFLTFVFSYIQAHGVHALEKYVGNRALRVVFVAVVFLGTLVSVGSFLAPRVKQQASVIADKLPQYMQSIDNEIFEMSKQYPLLENLVAHPKPEAPADVAPVEPHWSAKDSAIAAILQHYLSEEGAVPSNGTADFSGALDVLRGVGRVLAAIGSAFLLALLFSFLIVLDLPRLTDSVVRLQNTKLRFIYEEVAESIENFGRVLGRALEAQMLIAFVNAILTGFIIIYLGIGESLAFLSVIVFLCSFIPVAGVFISSVPICLMVLAQSGVKMMFIAILLVWVIHLIEAYILNPKIFGHHLRINPVLVLIILTVAGKLFHVWGLVLGVPVCTYFFQHAIRIKDEAESP